MDKPGVKKHVSKLKHVIVYNRIFELIQNGTFPPGSQLPSETDLALQMDVSRMTLRKALTLLKDDNLLINLHGKGNFIKSNEAEAPYLNFSSPPIPNVTTETLTSIECQFRIEPPSPSIAQELQQKPAAVVIVGRWYKNTNKVFAYSLSFIPIEVVSEQTLDLNNKEELLAFLQELLYDPNYDKDYVFSYSASGNFSSVKYPLSEKNDFILIQEMIYQNCKLLVSSKHFVPIELYKMRLKSSSQLRNP